MKKSRASKKGKRGKGIPRDLEVLYGVNPVTESLRAGRRKILSVAIKQGSDKSSKAIAQIVDLAAGRKIPVERRDMDEIAKMAGAEGHQGVVAHSSGPVYSTFEKLLERLTKKECPTLLLLDGVQDPRNLGAIIRSAECFDIDGILIPDRRAASYTPAAAKSSAGAGEHMTICRVTNLAHAVTQLNDAGYRSFAFEADGEPLGSLPRGPLALVMGGEGTGVRPLVQKRCENTLRIEMNGTINSLNVSAASAIVLHAACRRAHENPVF